MILTDKREIGNRLLSVRKKLGLTQYEVAEAAGLSGRTYADIERGTVNMRLETILKICRVLQVTPDDLLTIQNNDLVSEHEELLAKLKNCSIKEQNTAYRLLAVYLDSLK